MIHLKKPELAPEESDRQVRAAVESMLDDIDQRGESAIRYFAKKFDHWEGDFVLTEAKKQALIDSLPESVKADIRFAYEQVYRFAEAQRDSLQSFEVETHPADQTRRPLQRRPERSEIHESSDLPANRRKRQ